MLSISWQLMPWRQKALGHQIAWNLRIDMQICCNATVPQYGDIARCHGGTIMSPAKTQ